MKKATALSFLCLAVTATSSAAWAVGVDQLGSLTLSGTIAAPVCALTMNKGTSSSANLTFNNVAHTQPIGRRTARCRRISGNGRDLGPPPYLHHQRQRFTASVQQPNQWQKRHFIERFTLYPVAAHLNLGIEHYAKHPRLSRLSGHAPPIGSH